MVGDGLRETEGRGVLQEYQSRKMIAGPTTNRSASSYGCGDAGVAEAASCAGDAGMTEEGVRLPGVQNRVCCDMEGPGAAFQDARTRR